MDVSENSGEESKPKRGRPRKEKSFNKFENGELRVELRDAILKSDGKLDGLINREDIARELAFIAFNRMVPPNYRQGALTQLTQLMGIQSASVKEEEVIQTEIMALDEIEKALLREKKVLAPHPVELDISSGKRVVVLGETTL